MYYVIFIYLIILYFCWIQVHFHHKKIITTTNKKCICFCFSLAWPSLSVVGRRMCAGHHCRPLKFVSRDRSTLAPSAPLGVRALSPRQSKSIC